MHNLRAPSLAGEANSRTVYVIVYATNFFNSGVRSVRKKLPCGRFFLCTLINEESPICDRGVCFEICESQFIGAKQAPVSANRAWLLLIEEFASKFASPNLLGRSKPLSLRTKPGYFSSRSLLRNLLGSPNKFLASRYSAICTAFVAAPFRRLSETIHMLTVFGCVSSLLNLPTNTSSFS